MAVSILQANKTSLVSPKSKTNLSEYSAYSFLTDYKSQFVSTPYAKVPSDLELVSRVTTKGKVKFCNADYILATGYNKRELLNKKASLTTHPQMPKAVLHHVIAELTKGNEAMAIVKHVDKEGKLYWLNTHFKPSATDNLTIAFSTKSVPTSEGAIEKIEKIYNTIFLIEYHADVDVAKNYFEGLLEMEYGNYDGFILNAFE